LAGSGELARGKTLYVRVLRQHIALFRGSDGVVRALDVRFHCAAGLLDGLGGLVWVGDRVVEWRVVGHGSRVIGR
jgi:hypothetical protein